MIQIYIKDRAIFKHKVFLTEGSRIIYQLKMSNLSEIMVLYNLQDSEQQSGFMPNRLITPDPFISQSLQNH